MAMTKCKECGHQISKSAAQCPSCGVKVRRTGLLTKIAAGVLGLAFVSAIVGQFSQQPTPSSSLRVSEKTSPAASTQTLEQGAEVARLREEKSAQALGLKWRYDESADKMGRGTIKQANVNSLNQVNFRFPYNGSQRGTLMLRVHPQHGKDVALSIDKGQFLCRTDGCSVAVRFDDGKPQNFSAVGSSDHSTTVLFIQNHDRFVAAARKAKKAFIEAEFYKEGNSVFEFDIADLKW